MGDLSRAYSPDYDPNPPAHYRQTTTPGVDGYLLVDCICGAEYSVRGGLNEARRLSEAEAAHIASARGEAVTHGDE